MVVAKPANNCQTLLDPDYGCRKTPRPDPAPPFIKTSQTSEASERKQWPVSRGYTCVEQYHAGYTCMGHTTSSRQMGLRNASTIEIYSTVNMTWNLKTVFFRKVYLSLPIGHSHWLEIPLFTVCHLDGTNLQVEQLEHQQNSLTAWLETECAAAGVAGLERKIMEGPLEQLWKHVKTTHKYHQIQIGVNKNQATSGLRNTGSLAGSFTFVDMVILWEYPKTRTPNTQPASNQPKQPSNKQLPPPTNQPTTQILPAPLFG